MNNNMNNKSYNQHNQNNQYNMNMPHESDDFMYPEVYRHLSPICDQIIKEMENKYGNIYLTDDLLNQMAEEAIRRSEMDRTDRMDKPDNMNNMNMDSVQTFHEFSGRYGRDHWRRYDRGALSDIAGILFLNQIFGRRRPFWRWR